MGPFLEREVDNGVITGLQRFRTRGLYQGIIGSTLEMVLRVQVAEPGQPGQLNGTLHITGPKLGWMWWAFKA